MMGTGWAGEHINKSRLTGGQLLIVIITFGPTRPRETKRLLIDLAYSHSLFSIIVIQTPLLVNRHWDGQGQLHWVQIISRCADVANWNWISTPMNNVSLKKKCATTGAITRIRVSRLKIFKDFISGDHDRWRGCAKKKDIANHKWSAIRVPGVHARHSQRNGNGGQGGINEVKAGALSAVEAGAAAYGTTIVVPILVKRGSPK